MVVYLAELSSPQGGSSEKPVLGTNEECGRVRKENGLQRARRGPKEMGSPMVELSRVRVPGSWGNLVIQV